MSFQIRIHLCAALIGLLVSPAIAATAQSAAVGTQPRNIVHNAAALHPFTNAAAVRRVDIAGIGDSNQIAGPESDYGWDHGYAKAWSDRFGEYGTGVGGLKTGTAWSHGYGYINRFGGPYGASNTGAPAELHKYRLWFDALGNGTNNFPDSYAYLGPTFQETTANWQPSMRIRPESALWGENLTWHVTYGTFPDGTGGFTPGASAGFTKIANAPRVNTSTGAYGLSDTSLTIPSSAYENLSPELAFGISNRTEGTTTGPFLGLWQRVTSERESGVSYSTTLAQGGRALVHAASALQVQSDDALREYLRNLVRHQNGDAMLLVNVIHGGNDGAFSQESVGPNPAPSHTPAGFADNMEAVIQRYRAVWTAMGHDPENLVFQYGPYHPQDGDAFGGTTLTKVERLANWEQAIIDLSNQHPEYNLAVVRGSRLTTPQTMVSNNWYNSELDHAHLSVQGYEMISELGVRQLLSYADPDAIANRSIVTSLSFEFDSDVSELLSPDDMLLRNLDSDTLISSEDMAVSWDEQTLTATWTFQGLPLGELPVGMYEARIPASSFASLEAAQADSEDFVFTFYADPIPEPAALGALLGAAMLLRRHR